MTKRAIKNNQNRALGKSERKQFVKYLEATKYGLVLLRNQIARKPFLSLVHLQDSLELEYKNWANIYFLHIARKIFKIILYWKQNSEERLQLKYNAIKF